MQTQNIIQASAKIVRITELKKGNVIKYVDEQYSSTEMRMAVVSDILNDGTKTFIELVSFKKDYHAGIKLEKRLLKGMDDVAIFPATKEDLIADFQSIKELATREIKEKREELAKMELNLAWLTETVETHQAQELTEPKFEELN